MKRIQIDCCGVCSLYRNNKCRTWEREARVPNKNEYCSGFKKKEATECKADASA